jgi:hypothetical protein
MASPFDLFNPFKNFQISPVTDWQRFIHPQFNVTINQGDAAIENHVLARAGSYGRQIGRMQEVLDLLIARMPPPLPSTVEQRSLEKYRSMRDKVVASVNEAKENDGETGTPDLSAWLDQLAALRDRGDERYAVFAARLQGFLAAHPPGADGGKRKSGPPK